MRPVYTELSAVGFSEWLHHDYRLVPANTTLDVALSSGANLTYSVEYTDDDIFAVIKPPRTLSRVGTTATLVFYDPHMLVVGDWVAVRAADAPFDGGFSVASVVDANTITYTVLNTGPTSPARPVIVEVRKARVRAHGGLTGKTADDVAGLVLPVRGVRLNVTAWAAGTARLTLIQSGW